MHDIPLGRVVVTSHSILNKTFGLSVLLHGALLALLVLVGTRGPISTDSPLRVRILEPPAPAAGPAPQAGPRVATPPPGRFSSEPSIRKERVTGALVSPGPGTPWVAEGQEPAGQRRAPSGEPATSSVESSRDSQDSGQRAIQGVPGRGQGETGEQVAARPAPEPIHPPTQRLPEPSRDVPPVTAPERGGLMLGGPLPGISTLPQGTSARPTQKVPGGTRPSLRDQIASLGSGLSGDTGELAKQTLALDSRDPVYLPYLARLKRRIQNEWVYPEEAWSRGVSGELLLVFTLNRNGSLTNVRLVHSSGFPILDQEALRAVKQAAPYDPFPPQMGEEPWNISASFHYYLPHRFRRN